MIEMQTLAAPMSVIRALADPPRPTPLREARERAMIPPDPTAPAGLRPTFSFTPLEQLREQRSVPPVQKIRDAEVAAAYARSAPARTSSARTLNETL